MFSILKILNILYSFRYIVTIGMFVQNIKQACDLYGNMEKIILIGGEGRSFKLLFRFKTRMKDIWTLYTGKL